MAEKIRSELYKKFIDFVAIDIQTERHRVNKRMLSVLFWCFLLPAAVSLLSILLVKLHVLPTSVRGHLDWVVLVFPILYSCYILLSEVIAQIPAAFRKGGGASTLDQAVKEDEWRKRVCENMRQSVDARSVEWGWIIKSFSMDLQSIQYRNKYLTGLAGAVFFLLMQGIDSLADEAEKVTWTKIPLLGWVETSGDLSQFAGLALFLVLLYISGTQTYYSLRRYLNCAELVAHRLEIEGD